MKNWTTAIFFRKNLTTTKLKITGRQLPKKVLFVYTTPLYNKMRFLKKKIRFEKKCATKKQFSVSVDEDRRAREYLVKDPSQVYPEFLISYRTKFDPEMSRKARKSKVTSSIVREQMRLQNNKSFTAQDWSKMTGLRSQPTTSNTVHISSTSLQPTNQCRKYHRNRDFLTIRSPKPKKYLCI